MVRIEEAANAGQHLYLARFGHAGEAARSFYGAGMAYLKTGDYAKAERALADLKDLVKAGIPVQTKVKTLEDALSDLSRRKT